MRVRGLATMAVLAGGALAGAVASAAVAPAVSRTLVTLAMSSTASGFGLIQDQGTARCVDYVGSTSDGGAHFGFLRRLASWRCASSSSPVALLASDGDGDGFAYGPALFVTHDGGSSWARSAQPGAVLAVSAVGRSIWMVQEECAHATSTRLCSLRLLQSADGGRSWAPSRAQPPGAVANRGLAAGDSAQGQSWLVRASASAAYLFGSPRSSTQAATVYAPLWSTDDGGSSWTQRRIPCRAGLSVVASVAPGGALVTVCAGGPGAGAQGKATAVSTDGGRTWSVHNRCDELGQPRCASYPLIYGYLGEVDATSAGTFYVIGLRSQLLVTHDGGASWTALATVGDVNGSPAQVIFFGAREGIVLGRLNNATAPVAIWHTSDGGASWSAVTPSYGS
jgi:photosystem II stability/assembly factor-like uncharacterized protein